MNNQKKNYVTTRQIDGRTGIQSPHERELESIGKNRLEIFLNNSPETVKNVIEGNLNGVIENIEFGEQYTVSFEYFPAVKIHILYFNYPEEENEPISGAELKFLFSGETVMMVPSEDLNSFIDITLEYLDYLISAEEQIYNLSTEKTSLLKMAINQRTEPFRNLKPAHLHALATFVGGSLENDDTNWVLTKAFFPEIAIILAYNSDNRDLDIQFGGANIEKINPYARNQLGIFLMNHCLRFISITYPTLKMPQIIKQTFSYSYLKSHLV